MNDPSPSAAEVAVHWVALVPTLDRSPWLADSLAALRQEGGTVVVVAPRGTALDGVAAVDEGILRVATNGELGFAAANRMGLEAAPPSDFVALVNDDAVVQPGWAAALLAELDAHPEAAAAQGVTLQLEAAASHADGGGVDGAGLAWNSWWQAVQRCRGLPAATVGDDPHEVFGVSATAAIYRRRALDQVAPLFDERLGSYYEDVDLAVRLRAAGWTARCVPTARVHHAGSTTGRSRGAARLVRRNRYAVLASALGSRLLPRLPTMVLRDAIDAARSLGRADLGSFAAITAGTVAGLASVPGRCAARSLPTGASLLHRLLRQGLLQPEDLRQWTP